jgi:hypothetical protein
MSPAVVSSCLTAAAAEPIAARRNRPHCADAVSQELSDPFGSDPNDLPLDAQRALQLSAALQRSAPALEHAALQCSATQRRSLQ